MKRNRIKKLIGVLEEVRDQQPEAFSMDDWFSYINDDDGSKHADVAWLSGNITDLTTHSCETVGCIAGWTLSHFWDDIKKADAIVPLGPDSIRVDIPRTAGTYLGLDADQWGYLFHGGWYDGYLDDATVEEALTELHWMLNATDQWEQEVLTYVGEQQAIEGGYHP